MDLTTIATVFVASCGACGDTGILSVGYDERAHLVHLIRDEAGERVPCGRAQLYRILRGRRPLNIGYGYWRAPESFS